MEMLPLWFSLIGKEEFEKKLPPIPQREEKMYCAEFFLMNFHTTQDGVEEVLIRDSFELKHYKTNSALLKHLTESLGWLQNNLYIREGFVDKSLNTDMYSPLKEFSLCYGPLTFKYKELEKAYNKQCVAFLPNHINPED